MKKGKSFARAGDFSDHNGSIMPPTCSLNVLINNRPAANRKSMHVCPQVIKSNPPIPHAVGPVISAGVTNVLINGLPAIGEGDKFLCAGGAAPPAKMKKGSPNVVFGAKSQTPSEAPAGGKVSDNGADSGVNSDNNADRGNDKNAGKKDKLQARLDKAGKAVVAADIAYGYLSKIESPLSGTEDIPLSDNAVGSERHTASCDGETSAADNKKNGQYGQARADAAKKVIEKYLSNGTTYSQEKGKRTYGLDAAYADCSSTTLTALREAGQGGLFKHEWTGQGAGGLGDGIQGEVRKIDNAAGVMDPYRKNDPRAGDIMMWAGHIAIVTEVTDEHVKWANMGVGSGPGIRSAKLSDTKTGAQVWSPDFWGFWTPPDSFIDKIITVS